MAEPTEREWLEGLRREDRDSITETVLDRLEANSPPGKAFAKYPVDEIRALLAVARAAERVNATESLHDDNREALDDALAPLLRLADDRTV